MSQPRHHALRADSADATETTDGADVLIVGAGPVGLLLASELAATGIRAVVLERSAEPSSVPKANGVVGRASAELSKRGYLTGTGLRIVTPPRFQFGPLVLPLGLRPGNPLHILPVPQRRLEELLERRATQRGAIVRRSHEVLGFTRTDRGVTVEVGHASTTMRMTARFLVGCDGARSTVRHHAGIGFPGFTSDEVARIARVTIPANAITPAGDGFEIPGVGRVAGMRRNRMPGGGFTIAPATTFDRDAPADLYVISTHEPLGDTLAGDAVSVEELHASLVRVLGVELPFTDAAAIRSTVGNSRLAETYRSGCVFLAGDAAHIFNAGGSALNVGMLDAFDLAGRLAEVLRRGASADELDAYEGTRRPAAERVLSHTRAQAALGRDDNDAVREVVGELVAHRGTARRLARILEVG